MTAALITPSILSWARKRASLSVDQLAQKTHVKLDQLKSWESGENNPTIHQAEVIANSLHIPFGYLFLSTIPDDEIPIPDLRTYKYNTSSGLSPEFKDVLNSVLRKQDWCREEMEVNESEKLPFVGSVSIATPIKDAAQIISHTLGVGSDRHRFRTWTEFLSDLVFRAESKGILVFRNSVVGSNTKRHLDLNEFLGFAVSDFYAPAIFINSNDYKTSQIFTLLHEMAHIWINQSGISDINETTSSDSKSSEVEQWCNRVAAEILCPEAIFLKQWSEIFVDDERRIESLSRRFWVSTTLVLRRAFELGMLSQSKFFQLLKVEKNKQLPPKKQDGGPDPWILLKFRNGKLFTQRVFSAVLDERLPIRDAATLLDCSVRNVENISKSWEKNR